MTGKIAAAYLRRSSATGDSPGDASRDAQEASVRRLCGDDVDLYVDWGISGSGDGSQRPEYQRLKAEIASGLIGSVCAYSLSRLGRNARELLAFIELAQAHDVPVRTAVESIDTSTAMGRAMLTVMAAFAQLELEQGKERSAAARDARQARHEAAGVAMPPSLSIYGRKHITADGITRVVDDPNRPIGPVLDAYRDAGSVRGACELLQARGIPAPKGGKVWGVSTLHRILEAYARDGLVDLPEPMTPRGDRRPVKVAKSVFAGLVKCHCGRTMTPNAQRHQLYCAAGRDSGAALHGQYSVTEAALRAVLEPEADRYQAQTKVWHKAAEATREGQERLDKARERWLVAFTAGSVSESRWRAETAKIDAQAADLAREAKGVLTLQRETIPSWDDVPAMNRHLRTIWRSVTLDEAMRPTVEWGIPGMLYDDEAVVASNDPSGLYGPEGES